MAPMQRKSHSNFAVSERPRTSAQWIVDTPSSFVVAIPLNSGIRPKAWVWQLVSIWPVGMTIGFKRLWLKMSPHLKPEQYLVLWFIDLHASEGENARHFAISDSTAVPVPSRKDSNCGMVNFHQDPFDPHALSVAKQRFSHSTANHFV